MQRDQGQQGRLFGAGEECIEPGAGASFPAGSAGDAPGQLTQPEGEITFDGVTYSYRGYVLEGGAYVRRTFTFTPDEVYIYPSEPLWRVRAMVDRVGRDAGRQAEIKRYGKRAWHSPYRPQDAPMQGLDWIFRHDVERVSACYPYVVGFYAADAAQADRWTLACYDAYRVYALHRSREPLLHLLKEAGIPPQLVLDHDP